MEAFEYLLMAKAICDKHRFTGESCGCMSANCPFALASVCLANDGNYKEKIAVVEKYILDEKAKKEKLEPCPFCGSQASMHVYDEAYGKAGIVGCKECTIWYKRLFDYSMSEAEIKTHLFNIWNRRAILHDQD